MTLLALAPGVSPGYTILNGNGVVDLTTLSMATLGANTGFTFPNTPGTTLVLVKTVTATPALTIVVGTTVLGLSVPAIAITTATTGDLYLLGPFYTADEQPQSNIIQINAGTPANIAGVTIIQPAQVP